MFKSTKIYLLCTLILAFAATSVSAQSQSKVKIRGQVAKHKKGFVHQAIPAPPNFTGFETTAATVAAPPSVPPSATAAFRGVNCDEAAGITYYDLQSNGVEAANLHVWPDGNVSAAWTTSAANETAGFSTRGTGYNRRDNWQAGNKTVDRIEASTRTGFSQYLVSDSGVEMVFAHRANGTGKNLIHTARREPGQTAWTESDLPTNTSNGGLWCHAAADGENFYVLYLTTPAGNSGVPVQGINGAVLFCRSKDAGKTWDKFDVIIPGMDSSKVAAIGSDSYAISANNGTIAVALMDSWNDLLVFKSTNGGDTWETPLVVHDFPLEKYVADKGYTLADIGGVDPNGPGATNSAPSLSDSLAVFTNDGSGSILVDDAGQVHVWFGQMFVTDGDLADGNTSYYPSINGLLYWNETFQTDEFVLAGDIIDANGNNTIDNLNLGTGPTSIAYGCSITGMTTAAMDDDFNLYLAYSALSDSLVSADGLSFRHIVVTKSFDLGKTWTPIKDIHYGLSHPDFAGLAEFQEGVWPRGVQKADGSFKFIFNLDYRPGSGVYETGTPAQDDETNIVYYCNTDLVSAPTLAKDGFQMLLLPNPASDRTQLKFRSQKTGEANLQVLNSLGAVVSTQNFKAVNGENAYDLNLANLNSGIYFVRLQIDNQFVAKKLMVSEK